MQFAFEINQLVYTHKKTMPLFEIYGIITGLDNVIRDKKPTTTTPSTNELNSSDFAKYDMMSMPYRIISLSQHLWQACWDLQWSVSGGCPEAITWQRGKVAQQEYLRAGIRRMQILYLRALKFNISERICT